MKPDSSIATWQNSANEAILVVKVSGKMKEKSVNLVSGMPAGNGVATKR